MRAKLDATVLYHQCSSLDAAEVRQGFEELGRLLFAVARKQFAPGQIDVAAVEDCVQEALKDIWHNLQRQRGPTHPTHFIRWSCAIVNHKCVDRLRAQGRRNEHSLEGLIETSPHLEAKLSDEQVGAHPESRVVLNAQRVQLLGDLERHPKLSSASKTVLIQGFLFEKNDVELAELLKIAYPNVRLIRHRNLQSLRSDLAWMATLRAQSS